MLGLILLVLLIFALAVVLGLAVHPVFWLLVAIAVVVAVAGRSRL
jgi:hypothetical protein